MKHLSKTFVKILIGSFIFLTIFFWGKCEPQKAIIDILGLMFILISEIILFAGIFLLNYLKQTRNKRLIKAVIIIALLVYLTITIIFYFTHKDIYENKIAIFVLINFIFIISVSILCKIIFFVINQSMENKIKKLKLVSKIKGFKTTVELLCNNINYINYEYELNKLYEDTKFFNNTIIIEKFDKVMVKKIYDLENKLNSNQKEEYLCIYLAICEIRSLIKNRNLIVGQKQQVEFYKI